MVSGLVVDLFAGGGGASVGLEAALGRPVDIAINHSPVALAVHTANHPRTEHYTEDVWRVDPLAVTHGRPVAVLWGSPDCRHFSNAKGDVPRSPKVRSLAWVICRWAKAVRPSVIFCENVPEFQKWGPLDRSTKKPIKARAGQTFRAWVKRLTDLGYRVDWKVLDACEHGAPTRRKRLFIVARCDGGPIRWPSATHGKGLLPLHTAAECIDWSLPSRSIFDRDKPLAEKTMWRIFEGLKRFVFNHPNPFIVKVNHGGREARCESIESPLSTVTAQRRGHALVIPVLQHSGNGERKGQRARHYDLSEPLGTIMATGQKHALVSCLLKNYGDPKRSDGGGGVVIGSDLREPMGTVTARDHHSLLEVELAEPGEQTDRVDQVRAFLTAYYGSDGTSGQSLFEPMRTITTKHRLGLVTVHGVDKQIADILFRMLYPHELLRAQFGRYADGYDLSAAKTLAMKVFVIGNSVPPEPAEALIRANDPQVEAEAA